MYVSPLHWPLRFDSIDSKFENYVLFIMPKRWNLRRRPPPQPGEDRSLQEREAAVTNKVSHSPATSTTTSSGGKKRKATEQKVNILYHNQQAIYCWHHSPLTLIHMLQYIWAPQNLCFKDMLRHRAGHSSAFVMKLLVVPSIILSAV